MEKVSKVITEFMDTQNKNINCIKCCFGKTLLTNPLVFQTLTHEKFQNVVRKITSILPLKHRKKSNWKRYIEGPYEYSINADNKNNVKCFNIKTYDIKRHCIPSLHGQIILLGQEIHRETPETFPSKKDYQHEKFIEILTLYISEFLQIIVEVADNKQDRFLYMLVDLEKKREIPNECIAEMIQKYSELLLTC